MNDTAMPSTIKAVLMDLDGTLADTARDIIPVVNTLCREEDHPPLDYERGRNHVSQGARAIVRAAFGEDLDTAREQQLTERFLQRYAETPCRKTVLFDGMTELIETLAHVQLAWGVVTNKATHLAAAIMETLDFPVRPGCLIAGDTLAQRKPDPEPLHEAARRLGVEAQDCLYLGDDPRDMQAARAAGMTGVIAAFGYIRPDADLSTWQGDATIDHPRELTALLGVAA